jgi:hypothetical protein
MKFVAMVAGFSKSTFYSVDYVPKLLTSWGTVHQVKLVTNDRSQKGETAGVRNL